MNIVPSATPLRFLMAVVAAFTISFSIASMASITGFLPSAKVDPQAPTFITPLTSHLQAAAATAARAAVAHDKSATTPAEAAESNEDKPAANAASSSAVAAP